MTTRKDAPARVSSNKKAKQPKARTAKKAKQPKGKTAQKVKQPKLVFSAYDAFMYGAPNEPFVYGALGDRLIFAPIRRALERAHAIATINWSPNWGELRQRMSRYRGDRLGEEWKQENGASSIPQPTATVNDVEREGFFTDIWAEEAFEMFDWLPHGIVDELVSSTSRAKPIATKSFELGGGDMLIVPCKNEKKAVAVFEKHGIKLLRSDDLINWAFGEFDFEEFDDSKVS